MVRLVAVVLGGAFVLFLEGTSEAQNFTWKGHTWKPTSGGMVGVCPGNPGNVSVDSNGYLHLRITNNGGTWTAAELFTTDRLGFGTYQWQVDAPIDRFDANVVLGLFPYGPNGPRTNEIDIEYSFWSRPTGVNADWVVYPASGTTVGSKSYKFSLNGGTTSTSRFFWGTARVDSFLMTGFVSIGSTVGLLDSWTYTPANPTVNIPQQALPLGMNLWCFSAPPSNGQNVEAVIRDFQFVPGGSPIDAGTPGSGGAAGVGGGGGAAGKGGGSGSGGAVGAGAGGGAGGGAAGKGGGSGSGGAVGAGAGGGAAGRGAGGATGVGGMTSSGGGAVTGGGGTISGSGAGGAPGVGGQPGVGDGSATGGAPTTGGASTTGGDAGSKGSPPPARGPEGGCGCKLVTANAIPQGNRLLLLSPLLFVWRRQRRRGAHSGRGSA